MQYWRPGGDEFVGDCMPFSHGSAFHLFYLLDRGHHHALGGLGGHQWAHASTRDLREWTHHPLALAVEEPWEGSICTGSMFAHGDTVHAFYATRLPDWTQHLGHAVSQDGIHFTKLEPRKLYSPPSGWSAVDCRDPFCFASPDGRFHLAVSAQRDDPALGTPGGVLLHLVSEDLYAWTAAPEPLLHPAEVGLPQGVPECADMFECNGRHYLLCGLGLVTYVLLGDSPLGPWHPAPVPVLDSPTLAVIKTAAFGDRRRLAAGWIGSAVPGDTGGSLRWGGNVIVRELVQLADGSLGTAFVPEMTPASEPATLAWAGPEPPRVEVSGRTATLRGGDAPAGISVATCGAPLRFTARIVPLAGRPTVTVLLGGASEADACAEVTVDHQEDAVRIGCAAINAVGAGRRDRPSYSLEVLWTADIVDACVGGNRCIVNRCRPGSGSTHTLRVTGGDVRIEDLDVCSIIAPQAP